MQRWRDLCTKGFKSISLLTPQDHWYLQVRCLTVRVKSDCRVLCSLSPAHNFSHYALRSQPLPGAACLFLSQLPHNTGARRCTFFHTSLLVCKGWTPHKHSCIFFSTSPYVLPWGFPPLCHLPNSWWKVQLLLCPSCCSNIITCHASNAAISCLFGLPLAMGSICTAWSTVVS